MEKLKETFNDLKLTTDEVNKLSEAFKKEEFRKLLREYAEELQDPENKRKYEEELTAMENERGMDVEFINPIAGHVLKTIQNSEKKIFVNICQSDKIEKPTVKKSTKDDVRGSMWSIPHSFSPPREDIDRKKEPCLIYDVVFSTNAYQIGTKNARFRKMLHDTALEGIEKMFGVELDRINFKILKMRMKGIPVATVIRHKRADFDKKQSILEERRDDPLRFPYPSTATETEKKEYSVTEPTSDEKNRFVTPIYRIKYSNDFDIADYTGDAVTKHRTRPQRMIIDITLPLVSSANSVDLDIDRFNLRLTTVKPVRYLLELKFTYPVLSDLGSAKFDKNTKILKLNLPIEQILETTALVNEDKIINRNLVEEQPTECDEKTDENQINDELQLVDNDHIIPTDTLDMQPDTESPSTSMFEETERTIPKITLRFRKNNFYAFLVCEIRNIDKTNWKVKYERLTVNKYQATIIFSNCGQGGWKNLYKIPLELVLNDEIKDMENSIQCFISEENMVVRLPLQFESTNLESISFLNQNFSCKVEEPVYSWDKMSSFEISEQVTKNDEPTFESAYGIVNENTIKIICTSLGSVLDPEKEFPMLNTQSSDDHQIIINEDKIEVCPQENVEKEEMSKEVEMIDTDKNVQLQSESIEKPQQMKPSIISSGFFEDRRSLEHRTTCPVNLCSDLLFELD